MKLRLLILALGMFVIGTDGFVIAGLLPDIAKAAGVGTASAGQLITIFALVYAVASPVLASALGRVERRLLLLLSLLVFVAGNVIVASSDIYGVLVAGRVIAAVGASAFTPAALGITATLATPERRGRAIALVTSGLTVATIIGVPIGAFIGASTGFQNVFWLIAAAALVVVILIVALFRPVPAPPPIGLRQRLRALRVPGVPTTLLVTLIVFLGAFTVYDYIAAYFQAQVGITGGLLSWVLLAFGIGGAIGNAAGGALSDRIGTRPTVLISVLALTVAFVGLWLAGHLTGLAVAATLFWGVSGWLLAPAQQHRLVNLGGASAPLLISLNSSAMYLGIAISGVLGGAAITAFGIGRLPAVGAVAGLVALAVVVAGYRAGRHANEARPSASPG